MKIELGNEGFLNNPGDMALLKSTFQIYIKTIATRLNAIDPQYKLISPTMDIINDDVALENFIKEHLGLMYHEQGALGMAPSAETGVVNQFGKIIGGLALLCVLVSSPCYNSHYHKCIIMNSNYLRNSIDIITNK